MHLFKRALQGLAAATAVVALLAAPAATGAATRGIACDPALIAPTGSLIGNMWRANGGGSGVFGCPTTREFGIPGVRGSWQEFRNGKIVWSPNQGPNLLLSMHRRDRQVVFRWSTTAPFNYDFFLVRWSRAWGFPVSPDQQVKVTGGSRTGGRLTVDFPRGEPGVGRSSSDGKTAGFAFKVEGCDGTFFGRSSCRQGWSLPISMRL
ncbi:LGFP repeat-containing protein [Sinosporangium siamense]|uniref:LGFP repeat-containing protein n=1 Tax=Sinosporangium siamense TaxID=1367973 RepID=A0A919V8E6_9ACTN|nr:hypothetical protein [Sinosporangium siamense]GII96060.1 hypothetical protein Ssi02_62910 [Sinosporangium siamense]